ncbi:MAG: SurA N-terminal domain-containing protein [Alphaproteobacteria bacterium]|nr:SurA N-terminal domain-containing protein [Alphaproteobacteria bacterium]
MLQAIRSRAGSYIVKILFALLILTFGIWGIGDIFRNRGSDTVVATVGDHNIHAEELQTALRRALEQLSARFGSTVDLQQAKQLGLVDQTLAQLIDRSLIDQEAARLGLDISDDQIRNVITANPSFKGSDGRFDRSLFGAVLAANNLTEDQYVALLRRDIPRNDLLHAVTAGVATPQPAVDLLYRYRNEKRTADILTLPTAGVADVGQPSEDELKAFYDKHPDLFRAPEYRGFTLVSLDPSEIAKGIEIPEAKLKEEYDQRQDELQIPERRDVEQILAPSEEKAKEAVAALAAGKDWREVATTIAGQNADTIDLGLMRREEMPSALGEAAFELPLDKPSDPIKTALGWHILRVVKIEPPVTQTFDEAKPKLEADLARQEAVDRIYKVANKADDALAGGATLGDVAEKFGLKTTTVEAVDAGGHDPQNKPVSLPVAASDVLKLAFGTNEGQTSRVTETPDGAIFALHIDKIMPSEVKPLDEVKEKAVAAWQADQRREIAAKQAEELAAAVTPETRLATVAAAKGLKATTSPPFTRHPENDSAVPPVLVGKLFAAKPGDVVTASDATGSYVAQLDEVQRPEEVSQTAAAGLSRELDNAQQVDLAEEFTRALRTRFPVEIHREALDQYF